ncbi:hypothetical protein CHU98_g10123, partial [Xylaria longipes]
AIARACAESEGTRSHNRSHAGPEHNNNNHRDPSLNPNDTPELPPATEQQQVYAPPKLQVSHDDSDVSSVRDYVTHLLYLEGEGARGSTGPSSRR